MTRILVTGATGKVGRNLIDRILKEPSLEGAAVRALAHTRKIPDHPRLEALQGDISQRADVERALDGITHVVHMATCKESPERIMDVAVKGLFWVLEECRRSDSFRRIVLIGGDSAMGHFFYPHPSPVTEQEPRRAYPGCYPLSKVLEEVMLEQYCTQYDLDGCCLRAGWIMEKDDFRYALSFGRDVFGLPRWYEYVGPRRAKELAALQTVPVMLDPRGEPVLRNILHVDDLVEAILAALFHPNARRQLFNIALNEPVNYRKVADYLRDTRGLPSLEIPTQYHRSWTDNAKARFLLGWAPAYDYRKLVDGAWGYERSAGEDRKIFYPG